MSTPHPSQTSIVPLSSLQTALISRQTFNDDAPKQSSMIAPPIVLALVSVAIFGCTMATLLVWRALQRSLNLPDPDTQWNGSFLFPRRGNRTRDRRNPDARERSGRSARRRPKKPVLWDLKAVHGRKNSANSSIDKWESIMPISAELHHRAKAVLELDSTLSTDAVTSSANPSTSRIENIAVTRSPFYWLFCSFRALFIRPQPNISPLAAEPATQTEVAPSNKHSMPENHKTHVQVTVAIAMPHHLQQQQPGRPADHNWRQHIEMSFGVYKSSWRGGPI